MDDLAPIYLLLMGNTMKLENKKNLCYVFDLKGSMVNREVPVTKSKKKKGTLKDINFLKVKTEEAESN